MSLFGFYACCFAGLSYALIVPVNNGINLVTPAESGLSNVSSSFSNDSAANVMSPVASTNITQSGTLEAISPNFKVLNPVVLEAPVRPLPVYMNAIATLVLLGQHDYFGQQLEGVFSYPDFPSVNIAIATPNSLFIRRYYVMWGIYYAALIMSTTGIFKESQFGLEFNNILVGTLSIEPAPGSNGTNKGGFTALSSSTKTALLSKYGSSVPETTLRIATPPTNLTLGTWSTISDADLADFQPNTPAHQTYILPSTNLSNPTPDHPVILIAYQLYGETIPSERVFFTMMECITASGLATYGARHVMPPGLACRSPSHNTYTYFKKFDDPLPPTEGPQWTYGILFKGLLAMTEVMVQARTFKEMNATVAVDEGSGNITVGAVFLKSGDRPAVGAEGAVTTA